MMNGMINPITIEIKNRCKAILIIPEYNNNPTLAFTNFFRLFKQKGTEFYVCITLLEIDSAGYV